MSATGSASSDSTGAGLSPAPRAAPRFSRLTRAARWARRTLFLVHRWLGVALALLMAGWAISGITMMYVAFPETSAEERLAGLQPLAMAGCCADDAVPEAALAGASVEMLLGRPVARLMTEQGPLTIPLDGGALPEIGAREAGQIAATHMRHAFGEQPGFDAAPIDRDQWTVYGRFRQYAPLYKVRFDDPRGTHLYVSGLTGEVVQDTSSRERAWNWLGAVPHWLYFTALREIQPLWYNLVVYASLLGIFLTVTGIYVGVVMYGRGKNRHKSPFRGIALWHHWTGLVFGLLTLTWVASGLVSMNPWGWLESPGPGEEVPNLAGREVARADAAMLVEALAADPPRGVAAAELSVQRGKPYAVLVRPDGERVRAALPGLAPAPLNDTELALLPRVAKPGTPVASARTIVGPDAYHYGHKREPVLPAYRVIYANADATRLYFDPRTGELINFVDAPTRAYRWWHLGLHRLDFPVLRERPLWDLVTVPLLLGVSLLCGLGVWMGVRRLMRPFGPLRRGAARHRR
jgi:hypothetical protein